MEGIDEPPQRKDIRNDLKGSIRAAIPSNFGFKDDSLTDDLDEIISLEEMIKDLDEVHFKDEMELYSDTVKRLKEIEQEIESILESLEEEKREFRKILNKR
ncbi:MAG: hypothetical protein ACMUIG_10640 [Thermoplasmatota archaeon]